MKKIKSNKFTNLINFKNNYLGFQLDWDEVFELASQGESKEEKKLLKEEVKFLLDNYELEDIKIYFNEYARVKFNKKTILELFDYIFKNL